MLVLSQFHLVLRACKWEGSGERAVQLLYLWNVLVYILCVNSEVFSVYT